MAIKENLTFGWETVGALAPIADVASRVFLSAIGGANSAISGARAIVLIGNERTKTMSETTPFPVVYFDLGDTLVVQKPSVAWVPGAKQTLKKLAQAGCRLGILSNTGSLTRTELEAFLPPDFDWAQFAPELILLSSETGLEKPSQEAFKLAIDRAGVPADQILFCTETLLDTLVAQRMGLRAARVIPAQVGSDIGSLPTTLSALSSPDVHNGAIR